jgi:hypothetical protein
LFGRHEWDSLLTHSFSHSRRKVFGRSAACTSHILRAASPDVHGMRHDLAHIDQRQIEAPEGAWPHRWVLH